MDEENKAVQLVNYIIENGIAGIGPLSSAESLAGEYIRDSRYANNAERCEALVNWESAKNFTSGFISGLGGLVTLPLSVPGALTASWIIQARMVAAIAKINGYDIKEDRVKTMILLTIVGGEIKDILKDAGYVLTTRLTISLIQQIPGKLLYEINKAVGFRLITRAGTTGIVNLMKVVPILGGAVTGTIDGFYCMKIGQKAIQLFTMESKE